MKNTTQVIRNRTPLIGLPLSRNSKSRIPPSSARLSPLRRGRPEKVTAEQFPNATNNADDANHVEGVAKSGVTTTTAGDAGKGAAEGAGIGLGLGVLAALASVFVPGFGLVLGGGALASAIGVAAATTVGGAIAGGVAGYLIELGVPDEAARTYADRIQSGSALVAVTLPSGKVDLIEGQELISKYGGSDVNVY